MAVNAQVLSPPLCVDLDGTLIRSDLLLESFLTLLKQNALYAFAAVLWLLRGGKAGLKAEIARRVTLNPAALPYNTELLAWLKTERANGRELYLCTAANEKLANTVARHLGLFSGVLASDDKNNIAGERKAEQLVERFGHAGFDYCGNERRDLAIWRVSRGAIVVNAPKSLAEQAGNSVKYFPSTGKRLKAAIRELRPHQWAKNVLVLLPLFAAHRMGDLESLRDGLLGLIAFCLCASSVYLLNDMLDLEADRAHARKCKRPFASGDLPLKDGFVLVPALMLGAAVIAAFLPGKFQIWLTAYYVLTAAYSFGLKKLLLVDAVALAGLYTLRIVAGAGASQVALSFWMLLFSVFLFLSLAFVKRYAELDSLRRQQRLQAVGRGYHVGDLAMLQSFGSSAGYMSVLVLALYINSTDIQQLYARPKLIWTLCVLMLFWISRVWMTAHRGQMHDDPVVYALRDKVSLGLGLIAAVTIAIAM
jgi:4-hydroxybenzoate polyprenyltransferase/phosphoserine phosphatase